MNKFNDMPRMRSRYSHYVFAYDISDTKRAYQVRRRLQSWRVGGQYSVHETELKPYQAEALTTEIIELMDQQEDRLFVARLSQRSHGPVFSIAHNPRDPKNC